MTKEEINALLPREITILFNDVDYEFCDFYDDVIPELQQVRTSEFDFYVQRAKGLRLPSAVALWYVTPKTEEEKRELRLDVAALSMGTTIEKMLEAYSVSQAILMTALCTEVSIGHRDVLDYVMIAQVSLYLICFYAAVEDSESILSSIEKIFFETLPKTDARFGRNARLIPLSAHPDLIPLVLAARVLADMGREHTAQKNWWRAVYRSLHDKGYAIARDEASFVLYMVDHLADWQRLAKAFGVPDKLAIPSMWQLTDKGKPDVDKASPLSRSGTGNYPYYSDTPWREWMDDFQQLFMASIQDTKAEEEMKKKFGPYIPKTMIAIATRMTEWLDLFTHDTVVEPL